MFRVGDRVKNNSLTFGIIITEKTMSWLSDGIVVACVDNNRILVKFDGDKKLLTNGGDKLEYSYSFYQTGSHTKNGPVIITKECDV